MRRALLIAVLLTVAMGAVDASHASPPFIEPMPHGQLHGVEEAVEEASFDKCFLLDGVRYHHIIDCRTGWPAKGAMSATVVAPSCADADVLDTALIVLGPEEGLKLIGSLPRTEALIVGMDGQVHATPGLKGRP